MRRGKTVSTSFSFWIVGNTPKQIFKSILVSMVAKLLQIILGYVMEKYNGL